LALQAGADPGAEEGVVDLHLLVGGVVLQAEEAAARLDDPGRPAAGRGARRGDELPVRQPQYSHKRSPEWFIQGGRPAETGPPAGKKAREGMSPPGPSSRRGAGVGAASLLLEEAAVQVQAVVARQPELDAVLLAVPGRGDQHVAALHHGPGEV